jgi:hypothetical protein
VVTDSVSSWIIALDYASACSFVTFLEMHSCPACPPSAPPLRRRRLLALPLGLQRPIPREWLPSQPKATLPLPRKLVLSVLSENVTYVLLIPILPHTRCIFRSHPTHQTTHAYFTRSTTRLPSRTLTLSWTPVTPLMSDRDAHSTQPSPPVPSPSSTDLSALPLSAIDRPATPLAAPRAGVPRDCAPPRAADGIESVSRAAGADR